MYRLVFNGSMMLIVGATSMASYSGRYEVPRVYNPSTATVLVKRNGSDEWEEVDAGELPESKGWSDGEMDGDCDER